MRYLLDTIIIGTITRPTPSESLLAWMSDRKPGSPGRRGRPRSSLAASCPSTTGRR
jgi:predicted nucleic acid-binding protein